MQRPPSPIRGAPGPDAIPVAEQIVPHDARSDAAFDERLDYWAASAFPEIASPSQARKLRKKGLLQKNRAVCPLPVTIGPGDRVSLFPRPVQRRLAPHQLGLRNARAALAALAATLSAALAGRRGRDPRPHVWQVDSCRARSNARSADEKAIHRQRSFDCDRAPAMFDPRACSASRW